MAVQNDRRGRIEGGEEEEGNGEDKRSREIGGARRISEDISKLTYFNGIHTPTHYNFETTPTHF